MRRALVVLACLGLAVACSDEHITLATLPETTDAGRPSEKTRCVSDSDCPSTAFCGRKLCTDISGFCFERPVLCPPDYDAVCGCDGISYWNECLRKLAGVTADADGMCELDTAVTCTFEIDHPGAPVTPVTTCPTGTSCARLFPAPQPGAPDCPVSSQGTCWHLPDTCPDDLSDEHWTKCDDPDTSCHTTCDSIRSGLPYQRGTTCQ